MAAAVQRNVLVNRWLKKPESFGKAEMDKLHENIAKWRERLTSISWFMRGVNETIARMVNAENKCKGHFWEGRVKSQALLDEAAVLSCMAYVDLNPIRAGMADDLNKSDFTSIQQRLYDYVKNKSNRNKDEQNIVKRVKGQEEIKKELDLGLPEAALMPFDGSSHTSVHTALPFTREDYFDLVDVTGRMIRNDKHGAIDADIPPIVARLGINRDKWISIFSALATPTVVVWGGCIKYRIMPSVLSSAGPRVLKLRRGFIRSWPPDQDNWGLATLAW